MFVALPFSMATPSAHGQHSVLGWTSFHSHGRRRMLAVLTFMDERVLRFPNASAPRRPSGDADSSQLHALAATAVNRRHGNGKFEKCAAAPCRKVIPLGEELRNIFGIASRKGLRRGRKCFRSAMRRAQCVREGIERFGG